MESAYIYMAGRLSHKSQSLLLSTIFLIYGLIIIAVVLVMGATVLGMKVTSPVLWMGANYLINALLGYLILVACPKVGIQTWLLVVTAISMVVLIVLQFYVAVELLRVSDEGLAMKSHLYMNAWFKKAVSGDAASMQTLNDYQRTQQCCGVYNYADYYNIGLHLPPSCCGFSDKEGDICSVKSQFDKDQDKWLTDGCEKRMREGIQKCLYIQIALMFFIVIPVIMLILVMEGLARKRGDCCG